MSRKCTPTLPPAYHPLTQASRRRRRTSPLITHPPTLPFNNNPLASIIPPPGIKETQEDRDRDRARAEFADKYDMGGDMKVREYTLVLLDLGGLLVVVVLLSDSTARAGT